MQKCSHKIPVNMPCAECAKLAKAKGLDEEGQRRKFEEEWSQIVYMTKRFR